MMLATIIFYGVIKPVWSSIDNAEQNYQQAIERQVRIEAKVGALKRPVNERAPISNRSLETLLSQSAGEEGFAVGKLDVQSDGQIIMTIESAKPRALFSWLSKLETQNIGVVELNVTATENTVVSANLVFQRIESQTPPI